MPANHHVIVIDRYGIRITAPVVLVERLGDGTAKVHIESGFYIETGYDFPAMYSTGSNEVKGKYRISAKTFTADLSYIYMGIFTRE